MRKLHTAAAIFAFPLLLAGCQNEPEETPDITEAIPLDEPEGDVSADATNADEDAGIEPSAPPIMESGSNEDGGREPDPSRSKLLPAN